MKRWVALLVALLSLWLAACQQAPQLEPRGDQSTTVEKGERAQKPPAEEVEKLTSKLASRDVKTFLEALPPVVEGDPSGEEKTARLMAPEGSVITVSDPVWSDSIGCWTVDVTIEATDYDLVERTMCLVLIEGQWYITSRNEVNGK